MPTPSSAKPKPKAPAAHAARPRPKSQPDAKGPSWLGPLRPFVSRPNIIAGAATALVAYLVGLFLHVPWLTRMLVAWDLGVIVFVGLVFRSMISIDVGQMKRRAADQDQGKSATLAISLIAAVASIAAIAGELVTAKDLSGWREGVQIALAFATIVLSWTFVHVAFSVHYAHVYYLGEKGTAAHAGGLDFPNDKQPDYWDFVHFSLVIGAAAQTADIAITSRTMRRLATVHTLIAFTFNTAIVAVMINIVAGLLQ